MTEQAYGVQAAAAAHGVPPPLLPPPVPCALCDTAIPVDAPRCPSCGLWAGGRGSQADRSTIVRLGAAFALVYVLTLLLVAVAR